METNVYKKTLRKNLQYHIIEGMLYLCTIPMVSAQTIMPSLIKRLGGSDVLIGSWPIVVYLAFYIPQIFSANFAAGSHYKKPIVIKRGLIQRIHILILALVVAIFGKTMPEIALYLIFIIYVSNQLTAGSVSPLWMDFFTKTTLTESRGKVLGWRTSLGAILALVNGFILTGLFSLLEFPFNYATIIALAFLYQMGSYIVQTRIIEMHPSHVLKTLPLSILFARVGRIIKNNHLFRRFLFASSLMTTSFSAAAFFTVAALEKFKISESAIGLFTILTIIGQIISGILGWLADIRGTKLALIVCYFCLILSIIIALFSPNIIFYYSVFVLMGIYIGSELSLRYNFLIEFVPADERAMYIAITNIWIAPLYLLTPAFGLLSLQLGYNAVFLMTLLPGILGLVQLLNVNNQIKTRDLRFGRNCYTFFQG